MFLKFTSRINSKQNKRIHYLHSNCFHALVRAEVSDICCWRRYLKGRISYQLMLTYATKTYEYKKVIVRDVFHHWEASRGVVPAKWAIL